MRPVIRPADLSGEPARYDVGMESYPGMRSFLPSMTLQEMDALRTDLQHFIEDAGYADARNAH